MSDTSTRSPSTAASVGFLLIVLGLWLFLQGGFGGGVDRLVSYADPGNEPDNAGARGSAYTGRMSARERNRWLSVPIGIPRGDPIVHDVLAGACKKANVATTCISWHRPGANVRGDPDNPSCHRHGKGSGAGAMDLKPKSGKPADLDRLDTQLRKTPQVGEVVWRGDSDHDPAAGAGSDWHLHGAVNCG